MAIVEVKLTTGMIHDAQDRRMQLGGGEKDEEEGDGKETGRGREGRREREAEEPRRRSIHESKKSTRVGGETLLGRGVSQ